MSDDEVRAAVLEHLQAMFTTRVGSALVATDYGITSVTDIVHSCPDAIGDVMKSIRETIKKYEPRLVSFNVRHVSQSELRDATIRFEISGEVLNGTRRTSIKFQTVIDAKRIIRVEV